MAATTTIPEAFTPTAELPGVLVCASAVGAFAGEPSGASDGGAGGDAANGDGAFALGLGLGARDGVGEGELTGSGAGAGEGDFPNNSDGSNRLSTLKIASGVESRTVSAILDGPTPVWRVTASPAVVVVMSNFPALPVARVLIGSLVVFNVPIGV